jgi:acetyl-CoA carboxylase biotin carboxyl carrier protein
MNLEEIQKLLALMRENDLLEVEIEEEGRKVRLKKKGDVSCAAPVPAFANAPAPGAAPHASPPPPAAPAADAGLLTIHSPMVGTFYRSAKPDAEAFVEAGDEVAEDTVLCIIEAMKVMNEIKAEMKGRVERILAENGEAVEFGQPLFLIRPAAA